MGKPWEPRKYQTPEELNDKIDEYFDNVDEELDITITGLILYLGFADRVSFYDYEKKEGYAYTIKKARSRIEHSYEKSLRKDGRSGDIFALKNFGWRDKQDIDLSIGKKPKPDLSKLSKEELKTLAALNRKRKS